MNNLTRTILPIAVVSSVVALAACSSSSKSGSSAETTAAKVDSARAESVVRLNDAAQLVTELGGKIPASVAGSAQCVVAVPSMVKGGVIIGGQSGKGYATCHTAQGWSSPAPVVISGGTLGAQLGVQSTDLLALVTSEAGAKALETGNFRVGVDASASAGPVGTGRGTTTSDVVTYSRSQGLFAGADMSGATIKHDTDASRALYGSPKELKAILEGQVSPLKDDSSDRFLSAVRSTFGKSRGGSR